MSFSHRSRGILLKFYIYCFNEAAERHTARSTLVKYEMLILLKENPAHNVRLPIWEG